MESNDLRFERPARSWRTASAVVTTQQAGIPAPWEQPWRRLTQDTEIQPVDSQDRDDGKISQVSSISSERITNRRWEKPWRKHTNTSTRHNGGVEGGKSTAYVVPQRRQAKGPSPSSVSLSQPDFVKSGNEAKHPIARSSTKTTTNQADAYWLDDLPMRWSDTLDIEGDDEEFSREFLSAQSAKDEQHSPAFEAVEIEDVYATWTSVLEEEEEASKQSWYTASAQAVWVNTDLVNGEEGSRKNVKTQKSEPKRHSTWGPIRPGRHGGKRHKKRK